MVHSAGEKSFARLEKSSAKEHTERSARFHRFEPLSRIRVAADLPAEVALMDTGGHLQVQEHAEEISAAKEKAKQENKRQLALAAKSIVAAFKPTDRPYNHSGVSPAWKLILQHLAKQVEVRF